MKSLLIKFTIRRRKRAKSIGVTDVFLPFDVNVITYVWLTNGPID